MNIVLSVVFLVLALPLIARASDVESRSEARFARKVERNAIAAKRTAARLSLRTEQRKERDARDVPYKGNMVAAYVRRVEKQKKHDADRAAKEKQKKAERQDETDADWSDLFGSSDVVTKHKPPRDAVPSSRRRVK